MNRIDNFYRAVDLYKVNLAAQMKVKNNSAKLAWLDATRCQADVVIARSEDLERYENEAREASQEFVNFVVENDLVGAVVGIIQKANEQ